MILRVTGTQRFANHVCRPEIFNRNIFTDQQVFASRKCSPAISLYQRERKKLQEIWIHIEYAIFLNEFFFADGE